MKKLILLIVCFASIQLYSRQRSVSNEFHLAKNHLKHPSFSKQDSPSAGFIIKLLHTLKIKKITFDVYSKMKEAPSLSEMKQNILEKYPLSALIYCKKSTLQEITLKSLNELINNGFQGCKKVEITPLQIEF